MNTPSDIRIWIYFRAWLLLQSHALFDTAISQAQYLSEQNYDLVFASWARIFFLQTTDVINALYHFSLSRNAELITLGWELLFCKLFRESPFREWIQLIGWWPIIDQCKVSLFLLIISPIVKTLCLSIPRMQAICQHLIQDNLCFFVWMQSEQEGWNVASLHLS